MVTTASSKFPNSLPVGTNLLWFEIREVLGQGGFGITYLAHDTNLDQPVALKEYLPGILATRGQELAITPTSADHQADFDTGLRRFIDEGRVLARFDHPAIVRVHSVFEANGTAYLVMRYEHGETLEALLKREKRLDETRVRAILDDVMAGLEQLHAAGFIHRDIKPGNLYLREEGQALLIDFGAARQAINSQTLNVTSLVSPGYAPFEQYRSDGSAQGPWTDIYALGATAYRAITGRAPAPAVDRSHRILDGNCDLVPTLSTAGIDEYSWSLLASIDCALAFRAADRPQTLAAWRDMLAANEPATAPSVGSARVMPAHHTGQQFPLTGGDLEQGSRADDTLVATTAATLTVPNTVRPAHHVPAMPAPRHPIPPRRGRWMIAAGIALAVAFSLIGLRELTARSRPGNALDAAGQPGTAAVFTIPVGPNRGHATELPSNPTVNPIPGLLAAAEADLVALRLSTPPGNNALEMYREVLQLDPRDRAALAGLDRIVQRYVELAAAKSIRGDFATARDYLGIASGIKPGDPRVQLELATLNRRESATPPPSAASSGSQGSSGTALSNMVNNLIVRPTKRGAAKIRRVWRKYN